MGRLPLELGARRTPEASDAPLERTGTVPIFTSETAQPLCQLSPESRFNPPRRPAWLVQEPTTL